MELEIGAWKIRSWSLGDVKALVKYANNRGVWKNLRHTFPHPYTEKDARAWIKKALRDEPETYFAIASSKEAIGAIGLKLHEEGSRRSAEIGYWLGQPFWGKGIATRAVRTLTAWAFQNFDLERIFAYVFEWNHPSARVLLKAGFVREGRLRSRPTKYGKPVDHFRFAILREDLNRRHPE